MGMVNLDISREKMEIRDRAGRYVLLRDVGWRSSELGTVFQEVIHPHI